MIPKNIIRQHVLAAIAEIDRVGAPDRKASRKFALDYPPKYVVSVATRQANGTELPPSAFNGGAETNNFLRSLGFNINDSPSVRVSMSPSQPPLPPATAAAANTGEVTHEDAGVVPAYAETRHGLHRINKVQR